ncbi:MAG: NUDIX domain-containing protein, partial [Thermoguttaceae bacterium]|nr:NUDIX domain-containing protein [Thermoguttaceae bacterium]
ARLLALRDEPTTTAAQRTLWRFAEDWLPPENSTSPPDYRSLNAALIDLGRLVCAPTEPRCDVCPLARFCAAFAAGLENELPSRKEKTAPIPRMDVAFWISRRDLFPEAPETTAENASDVLLIRRPQDALWAGLWDFPKFELAPENLAGRDSADFDSAAVADWLQLFLEETIGAPSFDYRPGPVLTTVKHSVTRYRTTLYLCRLRATPPTSARVSRRLGEPTLEWRWTPLADLAETPLSSPGRKLARFVALESAPAASRGRLF